MVLWKQIWVQSVLVLHAYYNVHSCGQETWNSLGWMFAQWRLWGLIVDLVHMWPFSEAGICSSLSLRWNFSLKHHTYLSLKSLANGCAALCYAQGRWHFACQSRLAWLHWYLIWEAANAVFVFLCVCTYIGACIQISLPWWNGALVKLTHGSKAC